MGRLQGFVVAASGAIACLMLGLLLGVLAAGGKPSRVLSVIRDPVSPASAANVTTRLRSDAAFTVTRVLTSAQTDPHVTVTRTVTRPGTTQTITLPASTVTVTLTSTTTEPTTSTGTTQGTSTAAP